MPSAIRQIRNSRESGGVRLALEKLYEKYSHRHLVKPDPLQFVYRYSGRIDREIAAFLASALAYGRVQQIEKSLERLFGRMGSRPSDFVRDFDERKRAQLKDFKHRFTTGDDVADLLELLRDALTQSGSLEAYFLRGYKPSDKNVIPALSRFCDCLCETHAARHGGRAGGGLMYLLASPARNSACKRLNLFLRWMVRDDEVDTGLWKSIDKAKLIVPVDVHMGRLCRILALYSRKTVSLSTALEITEGFARIEPADPVKYDFALSRIGIVENCDGTYRLDCEQCELLEFCRRGE
jgi:uncharacterized protein (TIGR02757 family)